MNISGFRDGIFALRTRRFGSIAEIMVKKLYGLEDSHTLEYDKFDRIQDKRIEIKFSTVMKSNDERINEDNVVDQCFKANLANTGATLVVADMLYVADAKSPALRFRYRVDGREFEGRVFFTYTFTPRTNPNTVTLTYKGVEQDGTSFLKRVGNGDEQVGLSLIKSMFEHKYGVTCSMGGTFNPSSMLFTSTEDANLTFIVTKRTY